MKLLARIATAVGVVCGMIASASAESPLPSVQTNSQTAARVGPLALRLSAPKTATAAMMARVRGALTDDLRRPPWRGSSNPMAGHCYVASEALYHLLGGRAQGWVPQFVKHEGSPHWFLRNERTGQIVDPTASQFRTPVPYDRARGKGFLTAQPSHRAKIVIERVRATAGLPGTTGPR